MCFTAFALQLPWWSTISWQPSVSPYTHKKHFVCYGSGLLSGPYDFTYLLILQLSCVLHMVPFWTERTRLRVMMVEDREWLVTHLAHGAMGWRGGDGWWVGLTCLVTMEMTTVAIVMTIILMVVSHTDDDYVTNHLPTMYYQNPESYPLHVNCLIMLLPWPHVNHIQSM